MASSVSFKRSVPANPAVATPAAAPVTPPAPAPTVAAQPTPAPKPVEQVLAAAKEPTPTVPAAVAAALAAPQPAGEVANIDDEYAGVGGFVGEWSSRDMATPYLTILGKTSKAFDLHPDWLGQWVYDKEYPLGTKLRVVFLSATKWIVEDLPFGTQQVPQRFARMADARAAGFNEGQLKDTAELDLLMEFPSDLEGVSDLAHIVDGDKCYVLARYSVQSTAFGKTASILAKDMGGFLRGCLFGGFYEMVTQSKTSPKGTYFIPVLKTDGKTPVTLKDQIVERLQAVNVKAA